MIPQDHMSSAVDAAVARLVAKAFVDLSAIKGCSEADLRVIEATRGVTLPSVYRQFMLRLGRDAGQFLRGTDFLYPELMGLQALPAPLLKTSGALFELTPAHFVFMSHQGYQFLFFACDAGDDPPVMHYLEGDTLPRQVAPCFSDWLSGCVADELGESS